MQFEPNITTKALKNTEIGELIVCRYDNHDALMILIEKKPRYALVALLDLPGVEDFSPGYAKVNPNDICASYGSDWAIQLTSRPTLINSNLRHSTGVISLTTDQQAILALSPYGPATIYDELYYDLTSKSLTDLCEDSCSVTSWAIWPSREAMSDPRQEPIHKLKLS